MATGQGTLMLADLPFVYSISNILIILFSNSNGIERFYIAGLLAGMFGTFLVIIHPIQKILDGFWKKRIEKISKYGIPQTITSPPVKMEINRINFLISLKTPAINFEKDKIAGTIYFTIILMATGVALTQPKFLHQIGLENFQYTWILLLIIFAMFNITSYIWGKELRQFGYKLRISALFFELLHTYSKNVDVMRLDMIKRSIDLNDWNSASELIERLIIDNRKFMDL